MPLCFRACASSSGFRAVQRDDAGTAETEIVLQADARVRYLARAGAAAQLLDEFRALRETGRAERVAFRQQAAGRIGDDRATVGIVAIADEFLGAALRTQAARSEGSRMGKKGVS